MTFNIEYGGEEVEFSSVAKAIEAADADVVAINEGYGNIAKVADDLGWPYYDVRSQIVSRMPLLTPAGDDMPLRRAARTTDGRAVLVEVAPGRVAAVVNVHLPATPYSPFKVVGGAKVGEVLAIERRFRVPALQRPQETATSLIDDDVPVFVLGDYNAPSDLDWTEEAVGLRDHVRYPVAWPTSVAAEESGLVDSYRAVHPDPIADQGLTWPADRPTVQGYNPADGGQPADRIDLLFSGGPARATESSLVGEGGSGSDIVVKPWPTDHRAVVSEFEVQPAPSPTLVSVRSRLVEVGHPLVADYRAADSDAASLVVTADDGDPEVTEPLGGDAAAGSARVDTSRLAPGAYELGLLDADAEELVATQFWVAPRGGEPRLSTTSRTYSRGEPIGVTWTATPGNRNDWLAVYPHGGDPNVDSYLGWSYTGAQVAGSTRFDDRTTGLDWPLPTGRYSLYLLEDDGYQVLAGTDFSVR